mmetsp:Transcript_12568/g.21156  ORF Transcript_12568/g.21156 Transcript_12568/m.21156 type:complete len:130 (+) Transcript_12568:49-438(+)
MGSSKKIQTKSDTEESLPQSPLVGGDYVEGYTDLTKTPARWLMLFMACCFLLGSYYCYDIPGVIENEIEHDFNITQTKWTLLYTVYSLPNMILPLFGGIMLDKIGVRLGLLLFTLVLTLGQFIFYLGGS